MALTIHSKEKKVTNRIIRLKSFTRNVWYEIDLTAKTCSCPKFKFENDCKHLKAVGVYKWRYFKQVTHPTFSQALSALVKSIRIRNVDEAVYWLLYLDHYFHDKDKRFRVARRILIGAAEDGQSISVMERVAENFPVYSNLNKDLLYLVAEVVRICQVPNWWHPVSGGHDYIRCGLVGKRQNVMYGPKQQEMSDVQAKLHAAIQQKDRVNAVGLILKIEGMIGGSSKLAEYVMQLATQYDNAEANRLMTIHLSRRSPLSDDANFVAQAVWYLAGGDSPVKDKCPDVVAGVCYDLIDKAKKAWQKPHLIPNWCCDGIHSAGNDIRYMGMWDKMYSVCLAFNDLGTVEPEKYVWDEKYRSLDGLKTLLVQEGEEGKE